MRLIPPPREDARLDAHFVRALGRLHSSPPARLGPAQSRARALHLERLDAYRQRRVFPRNRRFLGRALPHFIDELGTRCAMGHLIEATGASARDLVRYVARERNFERVHALADIPELSTWLEANGITLEEAGMIQPEYCGSAAENCVCQDVRYQGMVRGVADASATQITVDATYGHPTGVAIGDVVSLAKLDDVPVAAGDIVFATVYLEGLDAGYGARPHFTAKNATAAILVPTTGCTFPQVASIPGPVPYDVMLQALSAPNVSGCEQVLAAFDPAWQTEQGGPNCVSGGGGGGGGVGGTHTNQASDDGAGCQLSPTGGIEPTAIVVLSTAVVLRLSRRRPRPNQRSS